MAIITGGDSGIGRAVAVSYVKEGAKVVIPYYDEHRDANETKEYIEMLGGECELLSGDISDKEFCKYIVDFTLQRFGKIDILINNAGVQYQQDRLEDISEEQAKHVAEDFIGKEKIKDIEENVKKELKNAKEKPVEKAVVSAKLRNAEYQMENFEEVIGKLTKSKRFDSANKKEYEKLAKLEEDFGIQNIELEAAQLVTEEELTEEQLEDEELEDLPEEWVCPICFVGKEDFEPYDG